jgi:hypothetical protein
VTRDEYATFLYYFGARQESRSEVAELITDALQSLETSEWARPEVRSLPIAGAVMAFEELYPDRAAGWRKQFPALRRRIVAAAGLSADCPEWTDYHLAQWFLLRHEKCIDAVLDRAADADKEIWMPTRLKLQELASQSVPFRKALEKAREARKLAMLIQ